MTMLAGALLSTVASGWIPQRTLALAFAAIVYAGATQIFLGTKPGVHATPHVVPLHVAAAFAPAGHAVQFAPHDAGLPLGTHCSPHTW